MLISSNNKNPLINCERNWLEHQKPQSLWSLKISLKCMKKCMKNELKKKKKKGQNSLIGTRRQNPWRKFEGKWQKITWVGSVEGREPKSFLKSFEIVKNTRKAYVFKKPSERFSIGRKIGLINRKSHSIDPASIEMGRFKPNFLIAISIGQAISSINRKSEKIKFLKNKAF